MDAIMAIVEVGATLGIVFVVIPYLSGIAVAMFKKAKDKFE